MARGASYAVERPKRAEHGDLATNVAMVLTKRGRQAAAGHRRGAGEGARGERRRRLRRGGRPGFVNLRLHPSAFHAELADILRAGRGWGRAPAATGERINLEFVSANPTGPVTVASGRNAILGDSIGRLLEATGCRVTREYYVNDRGNQVRLFAESVRAAAEGSEPPAEGYKGAYVAELAAWLQRIEPALLRGRPGDARAHVRDLDAPRHSRVAHAPRHPAQPGRSARLLRRVVQRGVASPLGRGRRRHAPARGGRLPRAKDGALFFKAPEGTSDDKDRVVQKSDGTWAYFASDIAYFADKIARGYDRLLIVLGADHHGYVARVRNALAALGLPAERFEAILYQLVFITKGGEAVKIGKRAGNIVTVDEVMDEIDEAAGRRGAGADALRFFFLSRSANSNVEFDIDLAKKASLDNPVFYVQYGHARLCSILSNAAALGLASPSRDWAKLVHPDELAIAHKLGDFPDVVARGRPSARAAPHRLLRAGARARLPELLHAPQGRERPRPPAEEPCAQQAAGRRSGTSSKTAARLAWIEAIRGVYAAALDLVGVSAPERMERPPAETRREPRGDRKVGRRGLVRGTP